VAIADALNPVTKVMLLAMSTAIRASERPMFPTTQPKRKYIITPRMVKTLGV